jgi:hypothetical protein
MGILDIFGGAGNPGEAAGDILSKIRGEISPYYDPYIQMGRRVMPKLEDIFGQMSNDPGGYLNKIGQGFQQSPGYGFALQQGQQGLNRAAAAGGMLGSPANQADIAKMTTGYANQDYNNWMSQATGLLGQGLNGMSGLNQMGYNASNTLAQSIKDIMESQAQAAYEQSATADSAWGSALGGLGGIASSLFRGGGGMGGLFGGGGGGGITDLFNGWGGQGTDMGSAMPWL